MDEKTREQIYVIPKNLGSLYGLLGETLFGIPVRNAIEAGIAMLIVYFLVKLSPLQGQTNTVVTICAMGVFGIINIIGIKRQSLSQFAMGYINYLRTKNKYALNPILEEEDLG